MCPELVMKLVIGSLLLGFFVGFLIGRLPAQQSVLWEDNDDDENQY